VQGRAGVSDGRPGNRAFIRKVKTVNSDITVYVFMLSALYVVIPEVGSR
jgi:hypothetical protein